MNIVVVIMNILCQVDGFAVFFVAFKAIPYIYRNEMDRFCVVFLYYGSYNIV